MCYVLVGFTGDKKFFGVKDISANRIQKFGMLAKVSRNKENMNWYEK